MRTIFVSGCYDLLHGGHVEFFRAARALGDRLVVSVAGDAVLNRYKRRHPAIPLAHKVDVLRALRYVDEVVVSENLTPGLDFLDHFLRIRPQILAVTDDDRFQTAKRKLCEQVGAEYLKLPKSLAFEPVSTTEIRRNLARPGDCPLRVDFAGGWLDVPRLAVRDGYVVNCAVSPLVTLDQLRNESRIGTGMGVSAALALLSGEDPVAEELAMGVGWQDPAVIQETGLCVWRSGTRPVLDGKIHPDLVGLPARMALLWTSLRADTSTVIGTKPRHLDQILAAGRRARDAVARRDYTQLCEAVILSYREQLVEGMEPLPEHGEMAKKYCGAGFGGMALYLFHDPGARDAFVAERTEAMAIEPFMRFQD